MVTRAAVLAAKVDMKLDPADARQFHHLTNALHFFVSLRLKTSPELTTLEDFLDADTNITVVARDALFENVDLIDAFITAVVGKTNSRLSRKPPINSRAKRIRSSRKPSPSAGRAPNSPARW